MIKHLFIHLGLMVLMCACIVPFDPEIGGSGGSLVINGRITDQEGFHYIEISRADPVNTRSKFTPVSGYHVEVHDEQGNIFPGSEVEPGKYACMITQDFLTIGARFKLILLSAEGKSYESDYDELLPCPPIDTISYKIRAELTTDPDSNYQGAQFFVSTDATGEYAKNYLWEMVETWEYHSKYQVQDYYDGEIHSPPLWSDSLFYCWDTRIIPEIFVFSTRNLTVEEIKKFPLHFVSNTTDKLRVRYSLLLKQYSLSEPAYNFWKILEEQSKQGGELYETQPAVLSGNIHSLDDPQEAVLGLFFASSVQENRIYITPGIYTIRPNCDPFLYDLPGLLARLETYQPSSYPIYLVRFNEAGDLDFTYQECIDCRLRGGTTEIPDFWAYDPEPEPEPE